MTQEEIDELIKDLEKNYHVICKYIPEDDFEPEKLMIWPEPPPITFKGADLHKKNIRGKLNALDLIRF